jgi:predicted RNase H-like nuclease (RuvC/YqgF family)
MLWDERRNQLTCEETACERGEASGKREPMKPQDDLVREQQETIRLQQGQIESLQETVASLHEVLASLQEELARARMLSQEAVSLREQVEELSPHFPRFLAPPTSLRPDPSRMRCLPLIPCVWPDKRL